MLKILVLTLLVDSIYVLRRWGCDPDPVRRRYAGLT